MSPPVVRDMRSRLRVTACVACAALGVAASPGFAAEVKNGKIAFQSSRPDDEGFLNVFTMQPDGTQVTPLLPDLDNSWDPAWSPDGTKIAFASIGEEDFDVYAADAQGENVRRLTQNEEARDTSPAWSPGGGRIAFVSDVSGNFDVYTMNADGSGPLDVSDNLANDCGCFEPFLIFAQPAFSPDGTRIAFTSDMAAPGRNLDIYVMNRDGSDLRRLTRDPGRDAEPDWSPDGRTIAFQSDRDGDHEIFVMSPRGRFQQPITENTAEDLQPDWSPDGQSIAFVSDRSGAPDIWLLDEEGAATNLTNNAFFDERPDWQPVRVQEQATARRPGDRGAYPRKPERYRAERRRAH